MGGCAAKPARDGVAFTRGEALGAAADSRRWVDSAHTDIVNGVARSGTAGEWLTCSEDKTIARTDWATGAVVEVWRGHTRGVNRVVGVPAIDGALSASRAVIYAR